MIPKRQEQKKKGNIVAIDDKPRVLESIEKVLGEYNLIKFEDPLQALEYLKLNRPDLIILDDKMPGMIGKDVYSKIREFNNETPVFFYTAMPNTFGLFSELESLSGYCFQKETEGLKRMVETVNTLMGDKKWT